MNSNDNCVGIDVAKDKLDVFITAHEKLVTIPNDPLGHRQLLKLLKESSSTRICLESTGGLERTLVKTLISRKFEVSVVNPR